MNHEQGELKKNMSPLNVWGLALGAIIGWGCFVLPGNAFLPKAGPLGTALGMLIGGLLILIIALSYGYLIIKYPQSGGEFVYTKKTMGKTNAFICGWSMILAYWSLIPLNATAVALISRNLFPGIIQKGYLYEVAGWDVYAGEVVVASAFIIIMGLLNIRGIKQAAWTQTAIALTLVGGIILLFALTCFKGVEWSNLTPGFPNENNWWKSVFSIVAMAPWAYIGFDCIPQSAEEYNFSHKRSTRIMIQAITIAALLYIIINTITAVGYKPWQELLAEKQSWPTGFVVENMLGHVGLVILGIAMFCAVISGMNAFFISTSRLMYAMAQDGALPKAFGKLNKKYGTPTNAIIFIMILSLFAPWFGREVLLWIVDMTSVGAAIVFAYTSASAAILARNHGHTRQFIIGILGCIISIFFLSLLVVPGMPGYLGIQSRYCLIIWAILGLIFYLMRRKDYIKNAKND
ncbi:MAG: APC family permease [Candidatus Aphodosoma sp.]